MYENFNNHTCLQYYELSQRVLKFQDVYYVIVFLRYWCIHCLAEETSYLIHKVRVGFI